MSLDAAFFLSDEAELGQGKTLEFDRNPTVLLVFAANRFTRSAARFYQDQFGIGAMDWRMLVMLTKEPDIPVARASKVIGIDKAAVSRSLGRLSEKGLVEFSTPEGDSRRKTWKLTKEGLKLHAAVLKEALLRQEKLLKGFDKEEVLLFNSFLKRLQDNIADLDQVSTS